MTFSCKPPIWQVGNFLNASAQSQRFVTPQSFITVEPGGVSDVTFIGKQFGPWMTAHHKDSNKDLRHLNILEF